MNKNLYIVPILFITAMTTACHRVPAGHVGVKVHLLGSEKGDVQPIGLGRYWPQINVEYHNFPTFEQIAKWTKAGEDGSEHDQSITFQTKEGMVCNADVGINYEVDPDKVVDLFQRYRKGLPEITDKFLRNEVRNALVEAASSRPVEDVYGAGKQALFDEVEGRVRESVAANGIVVNQVYLLGNVRLPSTVTARINAKLEATQRAIQRENELRETEAEAKKVAAKAKGEADAKIAQARGDAEALLTRAKAEAEANRAVAKSLTPTLIELRKLEKWNGTLPQTVLGEGQTIVDLRK